MIDNKGAASALRSGCPFLFVAAVKFVTETFTSDDAEQINEGKFQSPIIPIKKEEHHEKITIFKTVNHSTAARPF